MFRRLTAGCVVGFVWLLLAGSVYAQTPRPTPTNIAPPGGGGNESSEGDDEKRGSISGFVYSDVNGDGQCVNTGVAGEEPVQGIDVRFVSSDRETIITHYSGDNGDFGLYPAGQSYWEVTIMPDSGWTVTSERTLYVPVYLESLNHENVNFCVARGGANAVINLTGSGDAIILLPESGVSAADRQANNHLEYGVVGFTAVVGLLFVLIGYYLERRRRLLTAQIEEGVKNR